MNVRFGSIHRLPQMDRTKNRSEQLMEAKVQNRWDGEIFSLSSAAIDTFEEGESTRDFEKASRKAAGVEKRLTNKPHPRVHVVLTDDVEGQHLTVYRFLKILDIKPPFIWKQFIQPILQGGFPTEQIHKLLDKMDSSEHVDVVDFLKQIEIQRKKETAAGKELSKEEVTLEVNDLTSRPLSQMQRNTSVFHRLGDHGLAIETKKSEDQNVDPVKSEAVCSPLSPEQMLGDGTEFSVNPIPQSQAKRRKPQAAGNDKTKEQEGRSIAAAVKPVKNADVKVDLHELSMDDMFVDY